MWSEVRTRARAIFRKKEMDEELAEEIRFHIEKQAEKYERAGASTTEAKRMARLRFGSTEKTEEECREARGVTFLEVLGQDTRYGLRMLRKIPGFTAIALLTLALGIGASTAVFGVVDGILLRPLPYPNPERIVMLWWRAPTSWTQEAESDKWPWQLGLFARFHPSTKAFEATGAFKTDFFNLTGWGEPVRIDGLRTSAGFFDALGVKPALGRTFTPKEDQLGHGLEVILSDGLWQERFGENRGIVGRQISLNGLYYTVVGVMPRGFSFPRAEEMPVSMSLPRKVQIWVPLEVPPPSVHLGPSEYAVIGRISEGANVAQAQAEMNVFGAELDREYPYAKGWFNPNVVPLSKQVVGNTQRPLLLILGAVGVVLLIASSNVASLVLARSLGRKQEFTLRGALGAGRGRLIRQVLTESLLLATLGGMAGILAAWLGVYCVKIFGPPDIPRLQEVTLDPRVFLFAMGITLTAGVLFGLAPALGTAKENLSESLSEGGQRTGTGAAHPKIRNGLLVGQVALALVLVIAAGLLIRTFYSMLSAGMGFNPTRVLTFQISLPPTKYPDVAHMTDAYQKALRAVQALPGVDAAGLVSEVPMGGATDSSVLRIQGHEKVEGQQDPFANYSFTSPGYFSAIGTPLLRGRDFTDSDTLDREHVAIINSTMAAKYWPGEDPIGKLVAVKTIKYPTRIIVGIVPNIKHLSLREDPDPEMYVPYTQNEIGFWPSMQTMQFALRAKGDPAKLTESVREALRRVDPDLPISSVARLEELVTESMAESRFTLFLLGSFGGLALALATIGMYGTISYSVVQRRREIGIRMALGATKKDVLEMVLRAGTRLAALGIALGLVASALVTRTMQSFLYGVRPTDPLTFAAVPAILMVVALLACYFPARQAARVDPLAALRHE